MENRLLEDWWFKLAESGPEEPTLDLERAVEKPCLTLATWNGCTPSLPPYVLNKFTEEDHYHKEWADLCTAFTSSMTRASIEASGSARVENPTEMTDPDYRVPPACPDLSKVLEACEVASVDFPHDRVCLPPAAVDKKVLLARNVFHLVWCLIPFCVAGSIPAGQQQRCQPFLSPKTTTSTRPLRLLLATPAVSPCSCIRAS